MIIRRMALNVRSVQACRPHAPYGEIRGALCRPCHRVEETLAGLLDRPADRSFVVPEAHFKHPLVQEIYWQCFGVPTRKPEVTAKIHEVKTRLKKANYEFIDRFKIELGP